MRALMEAHACSDGIACALMEAHARMWWWRHARKASAAHLLLHAAQLHLMCRTGNVPEACGVSPARCARPRCSMPRVSMQDMHARGHSGTTRSHADPRTWSETQDAFDAREEQVVWVPLVERMPQVAAPFAGFVASPSPQHYNPSPHPMPLHRMHWSNCFSGPPSPIFSPSHFFSHAQIAHAQSSQSATTMASCEELASSFVGGDEVHSSSPPARPASHGLMHKVQQLLCMGPLKLPLREGSGVVSSRATRPASECPFPRRTRSMHANGCEFRKTREPLSILLMVHAMR
jgi:hypothetical protein